MSRCDVCGNEYDRSFEVKTYEPKEAGKWQGGYERFVGVVKR